MRPQPLTGSLPLMPGPADSQDIFAPPTPSASGIPLSRLLPTYTRRVEQALNRQEIPPAERKRIRRYFEAIRKGVGR